MNPLCDNCYAERENHHWKWNKSGTWGPGAPRKLTSEHNWNEPFRWNRKALENDEVRRVFAFSLGDVFDEAGPVWPIDRPLPGMDRRLLPTLDYGAHFPGVVSAREVFLREVVAKTPHLTWLLLTKRFKFCVEELHRIFGDALPANVWVIYSAGTQQALEEAMQWLPKINASVLGISAEPLLGPMNFRQVQVGPNLWLDALTGAHMKNVYLPAGTPDPTPLPGMVRPVSWVIFGGESGPNSRLMNRDWLEAGISSRNRFQTKIFVKQLGVQLAKKLGIPGTGADPALWPEAFRIQEFPNAHMH